MRAAPLARVVRVKAKFTVKNAVCPSLLFAAYGESDCEFGFHSHEWSCSQNNNNPHVMCVDDLDEGVRSLHAVVVRADYP